MTPENNPYKDLNEVEKPSTHSAIENYIGQFGLDWHRDLKPQDLLVFFAARKVESLISDIKVSVGKSAETEQPPTLVQQKSEKRIDNTQYDDDETLSATFANSMDVGLVTRPEDIKDVLPSEWILEGIAPELFYQRLLSRQLLKWEWRDPNNNPQESYEPADDQDIHEEEAKPETEKPHAYVLLDKSDSMTKSGDKRDLAAQALTLAFLKRGYDEHAQLTFRPFHGQPLERSTGKTQADLKSITLRVLHGYNWGGNTNIQLAIEQAVKDIKAGGNLTGAEILLISDGESKLTRNPLGNIKLHTLFLGDTTYDPKLPEWSTTFRRIDKASLIAQSLPTKVYIVTGKQGNTS